MKTTSRTTLAALLGATICLTGCGRHVVDIRPAEPIPAEQQSSAKGNIHVLPMEKKSLILDVEPGVANLDSSWAILNQKTASSRNNGSMKPSEFVTTTDITRLVQERSILALRQSGFRVTQGDHVPGDADVILGPSLQLAFVSLSGPECPTAIVQVRADFKNARTGATATNTIIGHGQSFEYVAFGQGLEVAMSRGLGIAMSEALKDYQVKLVQDAKEQVAYTIDNRGTFLLPPQTELWNPRGFRVRSATGSESKSH